MYFSNTILQSVWSIGDGLNGRNVFTPVPRIEGYWVTAERRLEGEAENSRPVEPNVKKECIYRPTAYLH